MPARPVLDKSFSGDYEDHKQDARSAHIASASHGKPDRRQPHHGRQQDARINPSAALDAEALGKDKRLRPLLKLRKAQRKQLLGVENPRVEHALEKLEHMAQKNRRNNFDHCKGDRRKHKRQGCGKAGEKDIKEIMDPDATREDINGSVRRCANVSRSARTQQASSTHTAIAAASKADPGAKAMSVRASAQLLSVMRQVHLRGQSNEGTHSARLRRVDALQKGASLQCTPAVHIRAAVSFLNKLKPEQRPRTTEALAKWLQRRACAVKVFELMPPGALVATMLPLLSDRPLLKGAIAPFADATGFDQLGPAPELATEQALRSVRMLRRIEDQFVLAWNPSSRCHWLAQQSFVELAITPADLVDEMSKRGLIQSSGARDGQADLTLGPFTGPLSYNQRLIEEVEPPLELGQWFASDFEAVTKDVHVEQVTLSLGPDAFVQSSRARCLRATGGVDVSVKHWKESAMDAINGGERFLDFVVVKGVFEPPRWPTSILLTIAASATEKQLSERFAAEVRNIAETEISLSGPVIMDLGYGPIRQALFEEHGTQLKMLEARLGCTISVQGDGRIWAVFSRIRQVDASQSAEMIKDCEAVLRVACDAEPSFKCAACLSRDLASQLEIDSTPLVNAGRALHVHFAVGEVPNGDGSSDLHGWIDVLEFGLHIGVRGALERYQAAVEKARLTGMTSLKKWACGTVWETMFHDEEETLAYTAKAAESQLLHGGKVVFGRS